MNRTRVFILLAILVGVVVLVVGLLYVFVRPQSQGEAEQTVDRLVEQLTLRQSQVAISGATSGSREAKIAIANILTGIVDISEPTAQRALQDRLPQIQSILDVWRSQAVTVGEQQELATYTEALMTLQSALEQNDVISAKAALGILFTGRELLLQQYR